MSRVVETLIRPARDDAHNKGQPDPFRPAEYRQVTVYAGGEARIALYDSWLIVTNKEPLMRRILDNCLTDGGDSLARDESFMNARGTQPHPPTGWAYVNIKRLRDVFGFRKALASTADKPVGELLLGGILDILAKTPYATAELNVTPDRLTLAALPPVRPIPFLRRANITSGIGRKASAGPARPSRATALVDRLSRSGRLLGIRCRPVQRCDSGEVRAGRQSAFHVLLRAQFWPRHFGGVRSGHSVRRSTSRVCKPQTALARNQAAGIRARCCV